MARGTTQWSRRRSCVYAGLIVGAFFGLAELGARLVGVRPPVQARLMLRQLDVDIEFPFVESDPDTFWRPRAGFHGTFEERTVSVNALGLRGGPLELPKPARRRRLGCFGDSITFGYGADDGDTYPFRLGETLRPRDVDVANLGCTGFTTYQVLGRLRQYRGRLGLDVATFCVGWNDATRRVMDDRAYHRRLRVATLGETFARHVYLYRAFASLYTRPFRRSAEARWDVPRVALTDYRQNLADLVAQCRAAGVRPVFVELPARRGPRDPPPRVEYAQALRALADEQRVPFVELGEAGVSAGQAGNEHLFIDRFHLSAEGAAYVADRLARALVALGIV